MTFLTFPHREGITEIHCGVPFSALLPSFDRRRTIIVTDTTVGRLYGRQFDGYPVVTVGEGEKIKTLETVENVCRAFLEREIDRSWTVLAVGGGIVCDIAAFAAAVWMRGVRCALVPTTLLAMVDAAIGGKNGVNFDRYKNLVGTIRQPDKVIVDAGFLKTLPRREMLCGLAEIIKHGLIADAAYFAEVERTLGAGLSPETLIARSIEIKMTVVSQDETERGLRRILNFGHTIGHAIEKLDPSRAHGEAVAVGMALATELSWRYNYLSAEDVSRVHNLFLRVGLPLKTSLSAGDLMRTIRLDKKRRGEAIAFILLERIGKAIVVEIPLRELEDALAVVCERR